jgi:prolyl oligopeptidase
MPKLLRLAATMLAVSVLTAAGPPAAPTVDHVETLFGMTFYDPYHWMEAGGAAFNAWLSAEASFTRNTLDDIPGRKALLEQIHRLNAAESHVGGTVLAGGQWFYSMIGPRDSVAKIFVRSVTGNSVRLLIDPASFDADGQTAQIDYWSISPNGHHIAYGVSLGGTEIGTLRIRRVDTGTDLPDHVDRTRFARPTWMDDVSFLYSRLPPSTSGGEQSLTGGRVYVHRLGTDATGDIAIFGPGLVAGHDIPSNYFFRGLADPDSSVVVGEYDAGLTGSPKIIFVTPKAGVGSHSTWRQVSDFDDEIRGVVLHADNLFLRTVRDAPRQRILRTTAANPQLARADTLVPEGPGTINGMVAASDALYVQLAEGGRGRLARVPWGGTLESVAPPFDGSIVGLTANAAVPGLVLRMQSWTHSTTVFAYDPVARQFVDTGIARPSPISFDDIEVTEARAPTSDGEMVPLSIVAPRGTNQAGRRPALLYAYGAYGVSLDPTFNPMRRAWFDHGGIYIVAHVRGSGGFGDEWHRAGKLESKLNSVSDFIAAAEYLENNGWADPSTLAAMGTSAGGIVVGGAIVARPELFSAALIDVGLLNALRLEQLPIGPFNTGEFGSTETEEGVRMLYAIDAYHGVRDGVAYPGVIVSTARNDSRISPWMPAKFAARLQVATAGQRPELLRVEEAGGHAGGNVQRIEEEVADYYSFMLWQAGVPGFVPPRGP